MRNQIFDFSKWWKKLIAESTDGYEMEYKARQQIQQLSSKDKNTLLDGLMNVIKTTDKCNLIAMGIIAGNARLKDLKTIEKMAIERLNYKDDIQESDLTHFLRILAKGVSRFHAPLEHYLSQMPLPKYHSCIHWAFWPEHPDNFAHTYARYLSEVPFEHWKGSGIVQSFMYEPEAVKVLKNKAGKASWWHNFKENLLEQTNKGIWSTEECKAIINALE